MMLPPRNREGEFTTKGLAGRLAGVRGHMPGRRRIAGMAVAATLLLTVALAAISGRSPEAQPSASGEPIESMLPPPRGIAEQPSPARSLGCGSETGFAPLPPESLGPAPRAAVYAIDGDVFLYRFGSAAPVRLTQGKECEERSPKFRTSTEISLLRTESMPGQGMQRSRIYTIDLMTGEHEIAFTSRPDRALVDQYAWDATGARLAVAETSWHPWETTIYLRLLTADANMTRQLTRVEGTTRGEASTFDEAGMWWSPANHALLYVQRRMPGDGMHVLDAATGEHLVAPRTVAFARWVDPDHLLYATTFGSWHLLSPRGGEEEIRLGPTALHASLSPDAAAVAFHTRDEGLRVMDRRLERRILADAGLAFPQWMDHRTLLAMRIAPCPCRRSFSLIGGSVLIDIETGTRTSTPVVLLDADVRSEPARAE